jgi:hypothetical protein
MRPSFVIKGYSHGYKSVDPSVADTRYPINYIWINYITGIAYILDSIVNGIATWLVKLPDLIYNKGTDFQVNIIGDVSLLQISKSSEFVLPPNIVTSNPDTGEYPITSIKLNSHKKMVATYGDEE